MATTIKDVARESGVSIATVSLVFNRKPGVGKETRERVLGVARDLDYRRALPHGSDHLKRRTLRFLKISRRGHTVNRDHDSFITNSIAGLDQHRFNGCHRSYAKSFGGLAKVRHSGSREAGGRM